MKTHRVPFYSCLAILTGLLLFHSAPVVGVLDLAFLKLIQAFQGPRLDILSLYMAFVGGPFISLIVIGLLSLVFLKRKKIIELALFYGTFLFLTGFEYISKVKIDHPRPSEEYMRSINMPPLFANIPDVSVPGGNSFPSGHCLRALLLSGILAALIRPKSRAGGLIVYGLVVMYWGLSGWSRVYLGAHWPSDVLGGLMLGALGLIIYLRGEQLFPS